MKTNNPYFFTIFMIVKLIVVGVLFVYAMRAAYPLAIGSAYKNFGLFPEIAMELAMRTVLWVQVVAILMFFIPGIYILKRHVWRGLMDPKADALWDAGRDWVSRHVLQALMNPRAGRA